MMITIPVSEEIVRLSQTRGMQVDDFVATLIDKGLRAELERPALSSAIERIRALRSGGGPAKS
jgi:hypothetical protein